MNKVKWDKNEKYISSNGKNDKFKLSWRKIKSGKYSPIKMGPKNVRPKSYIKHVTG